MAGAQKVFPDGSPKIQKYPFMYEYTTFVKPMERPLQGRDMEKMQLMAAMLRPEICNVILLGEAGSGKALADDTPIPVADKRGFVPISDIKVGDMVFGKDGSPVKVLGVYPQGKLKAFEVKFTDGSTIVCNDEHIWNARRFYQFGDRKEFEDITLKEMMEYGIRHDITRKINGEYKVQRLKCWHIPVCKPIDRPDMKYKVSPYIVGAFAGKGLFANDGIVITAKEDGVFNHITDILSDVKTIKHKTRLFERTLTGKAVSDLKLNKMFSENLEDRRIPEEYLVGSINQRYDLLHGLMDTDGWIVNDETSVCTYTAVSEGLAGDVVELAHSLGIRARYAKVYTGKTKVAYTVHFSIEPKRKKDLFFVQEKRDVALRYESYYEKKKTYRAIYDDMSIDSVKELPKKVSMTCIYVEAEDHLYVAGKGYVVTHNTALVQGVMAEDRSRAYLEVDLPKMIANLKNENEMADKLKQLFQNIADFRMEENKELVLFIDEFHQIVQLSAAAVEVLKPLLADSGTRGIRVIAATTYIEFREWIAPNLPLVERLQRINLSQPDKATTISILKAYANRYGVGHFFKNDNMFGAIYEYTNKYIPANAQPRKSILLMDSMIGWARLTNKPIDMKMLADVLYQTEGINIALNYDADAVRNALDGAVFAQRAATKRIADRLHICCADLNNKNKPMSSFLFAGSTGVGKGLTNDTIVPVYDKSGKVRQKLNGDLAVGDYVFNRHGKPVQIVGVYPRGKQDIYEVKLADGRILNTDSSHLWTYTKTRSEQPEWYTNSTKDLFERWYSEKDMKKPKCWIPMNHAVDYPSAKLEVDPYVMGVFISAGCMTIKQLTLSVKDEAIVKDCAKVMGDCTGRKANRQSSSWVFPLNDASGRIKSKQTADIFKPYSEVYERLACDKRIPVEYMTASKKQRISLINGLFRASSSVTIDPAKSDQKVILSYATMSEGLAYDIQTVLYSLGLSSSVKVARRTKTPGGLYVQYKVSVQLSKKCFVGNSDNPMHGFDISKDEPEYSVTFVGISSIRKLDKQAETTCIYVDDEEHLYQAGQYVVSHNTEMTKQLAIQLFDSDRNLIRMDMTEYALEESLERFRDELTSHVWEHPFSIVLCDEIEKACGAVTRILLQVLDDGRLIDRHNREVTFKNCYIVVTTNAGSNIFADIGTYESSDTGDGANMERYDSLLRDAIKAQGSNRFPPELLGRIDCIVPFQPLSTATMRKICTTKLTKIKNEVFEKHGVSVNFEQNLVDYVVEEKLTTETDAGGARIVVSRVEQDILSMVSQAINHLRRESATGRPKEGFKMFVFVVGDMMIKNKDLVKSGAYVAVSRKPGEYKNGIGLRPSDENLLADSSDNLEFAKQVHPDAVQV